MTSELDSFVAYKKNPTIEARNKLVEQYLYIVEILIRKYLNKGIEYDDLYQVGALALVQAVERFDPNLGYQFSSFATPTILGEIKKYFRDKGWSLKVPRRLKETAAKVQSVKEDFYLEHQRYPTAKEIAALTGYSQEQVVEAMEGAQAYGTISLDKTFDDNGDEGGNSLIDRYAGFNDDRFQRIETKEIIDKVFDKLGKRDQYIFRERFIYNISQAEIAKTLGVSQMTISRAERSIIKQFRDEMNRSVTA